MRNFSKIFFMFFVIGALFLSCGDKSKAPKEQILAKVGDRYITADEFRTSFEFSLAPLRMSVDPKRAYLDYMIDELLMANEGYKLGLHNTRYVTSRLEQRRYDNLLEAFYMENVQGRVELSDEEIEDALMKSTVTWKMLVWPASSFEQAKKAQLEAAKTDLDDYIDKQIAAQEIPLTDKRIFYTDWLDFLDMPPDVLESIANVDIGKPTEPFRYGNGYAIAQVLDIHRQGISSDELKHGGKRKKIEERLFNIKSDAIVHALMDSIMTPLDVRARGLVIEDLTQPMFEWFKAGLPDGTSLFDVLEQPPDSARHYLQTINGMLDETLISSRFKNYSVKDFIAYSDYYRKALNESASFEDFQGRVITEIGRMIKNDAFIDIAAKEGFADSINVTEDLRKWEQKWTYDIYRNKLVMNISVSPEEASEYFQSRWRELGIANVDTTRFYKYKNVVYNAVLHEKQAAQIDSNLNELRKHFQIWINEELLTTIDVVDSLPGLQTTYFMRKNFNFKAYSPTVDMKWLSF
jgi:hypothetical protein